MEQESTASILRKLTRNSEQEWIADSMLAAGMGTACAMLIFLLQNYYH